MSERPTPLHRAIAEDALRLGVAQVVLDASQRALAAAAIEALAGADAALLASAHNALLAAYPQPHGHNGDAALRLMLAALLATSASAQDVQQTAGVVANAVADHAFRQSGSPREACEAFDWAARELSERAQQITDAHTPSS